MPFPLHKRRAIIMSINQFPEYYDYLTRILTSSVYDVAIETPLDFAANLSRRLNNKIYLKPCFRSKSAAHTTKWPSCRPNC